MMLLKEIRTVIILIDDSPMPAEFNFMYGLKETITPFNTLHELYEKQPWLDWIDQESLLLSNEPYGDTNMVLLWGSYKEIYGSRLLSPCGFVTVEDATKMDPVVWSDEV